MELKPIDADYAEYEAGLTRNAKDLFEETTIGVLAYFEAMLQSKRFALRPEFRMSQFDRQRFSNLECQFSDLMDTLAKSIVVNFESLVVACDDENRLGDRAEYVIKDVRDHAEKFLEKLAG